MVQAAKVKLYNVSGGGHDDLRVEIELSRTAATDFDGVRDAGGGGGGWGGGRGGFLGVRESECWAE